MVSMIFPWIFRMDFFFNSEKNMFRDLSHLASSLESRSLLTIPRYPYAATRNIWPKEVPELEEAFKATGKLVSWIPKNTGIQPESMGEWYSDANFRWGSWRAFQKNRWQRVFQRSNKNRFKSLGVYFFSAATGCCLWC